MGKSVTIRPAVVRSWGAAARTTGDDVRTAKPKVDSAEDNAQLARITELASHRALSRYVEQVSGGIGQVAGDIRGTGEKLAQTANVVTGTDDDGANLFRRWGGPCR
ncbi:MAG: hypothetical protein GEV07_28410 [Streptosporangiales bacterium]|nr:hypothetical protein [Streptosporangiales bacterium]